MAIEDDQRLEEALRNASAQGDTAAATQIAQEIRSRRAIGAQQDTSLITDDVGADPLANVPTSIGGVPVSDEIRQAILMGRRLEDPKEQRMLAARIAGRMVAESELGGVAGDFNRSQFATAIRSMGTGIFGLGDVVAAAGTVVGSGFGLSFGEALEAQREFRRAQEQKFPITSGIGEVAGAFIGGGAVLKVAKEVATGTRAGDVLRKITTFQKGQKAANVGRASLLGAAGGAITEGITEGEPGRGALIGVAAGPFGLALAKTLGVTVTALSAGLERAVSVTTSRVDAFLKDPAAKGLKVLASKLGVDAKEMSRRFLEFKAVTGKNPTITDIANPQAAAELRDIIVTSAGAAQIAREGAERTLGTRAQEIAEQVAGGRVTTTQTAQKAARRRVAKEQFAEAEKDSITFNPDEVQNLLNDVDLRRALPTTLKRRLNDAQEGIPEGQSVTLSGVDVNDLRIALRDRARGATGADRVFGELAQEVEEIARSQSKAFGRAIDEFARRSVRGEAVAAGRRVTTQPTEEFEAIVTQAEVPVARAGLRVGARAGIVDVAREGINASANLAKTLSENSGLIQRLRSVLPKREVDRLQDIGRVQSRSIANIGRLAPSTKVNTDLREAVSDAVNATVLASTSTSSASKVFAFGRILKGLGTGLSDRVRKNIARDAFDPKKTQQVIAALRRAELREEAILDLYARAALGAGTIATERTGGSSHKNDRNTDHLISDRKSGRNSDHNISDR